MRYRSNGDPDQSQVVEFQCGDPDCLTTWNSYVEAAPCQITGCTIVGCPDCFKVCERCAKTICSEHRRMFDDEAFCLDCMAEMEAEDAAERRGDAA